jgi:Tol biopolymer transport system component
VKPLVAFLTAVTLAALAPAAADATFPGANGRIAYHRVDDFQSPQRPYDILAVNPDGSHIVNITDDAAYDQEPAWSPDGSRIAFMRSYFIGEIIQIYVMKADGTAKTQLTHLPGISLSPSWSPDGSRIVFLYDEDLDGLAEIYTMAADGSDLRPVTSTGTNHISPKWSPAGDRILFSAAESADSESDYDLYTVRPDGTDLRRVAALPGDQLDPDWSPNGGQIVLATAYPRETPYRVVLHKLNANGTGLVSLGVSGYAPVWSPDGTRIAYQAWPASEGRTFDLATIRPDGSDFVYLDNDVGNEGSPSWQRLPTTVRLCRNGGWRNYGDRFRSERECIAFVREHARQECIFIRAAIGDRAFRERYGEGKHGLHAMRRCIDERSGG